MNIRILGSHDQVTQDDRNRASHRLQGATYRHLDQIRSAVARIGRPRRSESGSPWWFAAYRVELRDGRVLRERGRARRLEIAIDETAKALERRIEAALAEPAPARSAELPQPAGASLG